MKTYVHNKHTCTTKTTKHSQFFARNVTTAVRVRQNELNLAEAQKHAEQQEFFDVERATRIHVDERRQVLQLRVGELVLLLLQ